MTDTPDLKKLKKEIEDLKSQIEEKDEKIDEMNQQLEKNYIRYANENLILKILDTYEDLGRALKSKNPETLEEGVELIYKKLKDTLEGEGLQEICVEGEKFDPFKHEALMVEDHQDYDDGTVIEELGKGYTLDSKVIKYSKVKVCKKR